MSLFAQKSKFPNAEIFSPEEEKILFKRVFIFTMSFGLLRANKPLNDVNQLLERMGALLIGVTLVTMIFTPGLYLGPLILISYYSTLMIAVLKLTQHKDPKGIIDHQHYWSIFRVMK